MADPTIVAELKAAAEDALSRGFAILTCEPHDKAPYAKYSPHAVNSSTRKPEVALAAWIAGEEANYGVGCGPSNLTVVDCDHGLNNLEEFEAWRVKHGIPETYTVRTGRRTNEITGAPEYGVQMYFSGAVATCGFDIEGVTGELKGIGGYVCGAGSIHPISGEKYAILKDLPVVSLPEGFVNLAKEKKKTPDFTPASKGGELIKISTRWIHLQKMAGVFRNAGLDEDGIYVALLNFAKNNCEDGENYPDEKIKALAAWASSEKCDAAGMYGVVTVGSPDPDEESTIQELSNEVIVGDYLGDLSLALTKGTFIPPSFARATLKTMVGATLDGRIGFPNEETLHLRHWNALISARPEAGKSVIWERCLLFLKKLMEDHSIIFPHSGFFSSGEHAIKTLAENDGKAHLAYFDEMKSLFEKGSSSGSTLFSKLLELYEQKSAAVGSITNAKASFGNVSLNMTGGFTRDGYERSVAGKSAGGNGFLSRMVMEYSNGINYVGDWEALDPEAVNSAVEKIRESVKWIAQYVGDHEGKPFIPEETPDAAVERTLFQQWLNTERKRIQTENPDASYASRLEAHFKRDLLLRVAFSPDHTITKDKVKRSVLWAKHQLMLRESLWPVDNGGSVEKFEKRIISSIRKFGPLTKAGIQKYSNADKGEGGYEAWNRAWTNVLRADKVVVLSIKSNRGKEKYGFENSIWRVEKKEWISGD